MHRHKRRRLIGVLGAVAIVLVGTSACSESDEPATEPGDAAHIDLGSQDTGSTAPGCELARSGDDGQAFEYLSEYCFFRGDPATHEPSAGVMAYEVNAALYSDESEKARFIVLPVGAKISFDAQGRWDFPEGTILIKTFFYSHDMREPAQGRRILETRLLTLRDGAWRAHVYEWNGEQTDARRWSLGRSVPVEFIDAQGNEVSFGYRIPNTNQCMNCHAQDREMQPLGPRTRQLNRENDYGQGPVNQLEYFVAHNMFAGAIGDVEGLARLVDFADESVDLESRARSYLEANCAHCHNPGAAASSSALFLGVEVTDPIKYGVCKRPVASGRGSGDLTFDIVPGHPEQSIMIYRMNTNNPEYKMPELPLQTIDRFGVDLVSDWIAAMDDLDCE